MGVPAFEGTTMGQPEIPAPGRSQVRRASTLSLVSLLVLLFGTTGCLSFLRKAEEPMFSAAMPRESGASCAVVLLPGRLGSHNDFLDARFAEAVHERGLDIQVIAADAHVGYYRDRIFVERLREDVVAPLLAEGKQVWLAGVSMGGLGTLIYARQHPNDVSGVVAMAPFLGKEDLVREIRAAGGPLRYAPNPPPTADSIEGIWVWIASAYADGPPFPTYLAYGSEDRVRAGNELFATLIPEDHTLSLAGGHDWSVWKRLWEGMLDRSMICSPGSSGPGGGMEGSTPR